MKFAVAMIFLGAMIPAAQAQSPDQKPITTQSTPVAPPPITMPVPTGEPHLCKKDIAGDADIHGITRIGFTITAQGTVENVQVKQSSGNQMLDDEAVTCASKWLYKPATKEGVPVAVPWQAEVNWHVE